MNLQHPDQESKARIELMVLRVLCQESSNSRKNESIQLIRTYRWQESVHEAILRCLGQIPTEMLRDELPGCLTRKGFPDFDFDSLFAPHTLKQQEAEKLIRGLADS